jgi:hypothetical protein
MIMEESLGQREQVVSQGEHLPFLPLCEPITIIIFFDGYCLLITLQALH